MTINSPITDTGNISLISKFDTNKIISLYKDIGIEVNRFFKEADFIELYQCNDTLYRFYHPFSIMGDDLFYQDLYTTIPNYYYHGRWEYGFSLSAIPSFSKVLEIGCGSGVFLEQLTTKRCEVVGIELNSKAIEDCQKKGFEVHAEFIESFGPKKKEYFDMVCTFQVLEHVANVRSFITSALTALKPGGLFIVSVPNSNPYFHRFDKYHTLNLPPHHSGLWNKQSLKNIATTFSVDLVTIRTEPLKEYKEWYQTHVKHYKSTRPWLGFLLQLVPRPLYKLILRLFSPFIEGAYITAIYQKKSI